MQPLTFHPPTCKSPAFLEHQQLQPEDLLRFITQQQEQIIQLKEQIELLEAEIRRLKKLPAKPDIKPNTKPPDDDTGSPDGDPSAPEGNDGASPDTSSKQKVKKPNEKTRKQRKQPRKPSAEKSIPIAATDVPEGSIRNGTTPFHVQELTIQTSSIEYLLEQWVTPDGQTITAKPPASLHGHHYGPMLQAYVLHQYHGCSVTQPELLDWLWDIGISISSGELSQLLTKGHEQFHAEKDELLTTGIRCSSYIQTDDTGTRHKGKNGYCTIINNESFAWFESTDSKSRENFVSLLHRPWSTYTFTDDALIYLEKLDYPKKWLRVLNPYRGVTFLSHEAWEECMKDLRLTGRRRQQASEAMIYGSLIQHGAGHLTTFSDGARQFDVFKHSQCWIHAERGLAKVHPVNDQQAMAQKWLRTWFWAIYDDLKDFKTEPTEKKAIKVRQGFQALIQTQTCSGLLQDALSGLAVIKEELLLVLDDPSLPLHNNLSESQIREYVKRRKISSGTRSDLGRQCRDTFASLKKTCRLYGLSFWDYLKSRLMGDGLFPRLSNLIEEASRHLPCGAASSF
ncbi:transposase [Endozoicomonas sp. SCSIO W0465]|uniref:IS66 family transposase n=2 Tax=Endozoicomonas sp. SCSIO W0465 TaxID=2918516 RepID=UPI002074FD97|nr:transposase [Endozoicomonas sp. SCSIO W0465]USE38988.1 transposase [Endozoicomonas sp. SCSIO W0465]